MRLLLTVLVGLAALLVGCGEEDQQRPQAPSQERFEGSADLPSYEERKAEGERRCAKLAGAEKKACDAKPASEKDLKAAAARRCSKKEGAEKKGCLGAKTSAPECGSTREKCHIDVTVRQGSITTGSFCDSFDRASGFCVGSSVGSSAWSEPGYFPRQGIQTSFTWEGQGTGRRDVDYTAKAAFTIVDAKIVGNVPSSNSAVFNVTDATNRSDVHWKTDSTGAAPGQPGGPLYLDYDHPSSGLGTSVHMYGYLVPK